MKKIGTLLFTLLIFLNSTKVLAEEYINNYIDVEVPQEIIDEYERYSKNNNYNGIYLQTDSNGEVTTASISDTYYSSVDLGYVTSVKNQMSTGSCWAHAGMSVLETAAIKSGNATTSLNLSEMHLVYGTNASAFSDKEILDRYYLGGPLNSSNNGGNIIMTASYLYSGLGAVKDSLFPLKSYSSYGAGEIKPINSNGKERQITTAEFESIPSKPEYYINDFLRSYGTRGKCSSSVNDIKNMILNYGSVQVSINSETNNYHNTYYFVNTSSTSTNHAVTLVGWDDSIEASKFGFDDETKTGAWIMKNSWGTNKGKKGYYYVSYYDNTVCSTASTFNGIDNNVYDHVYDSSGMYYNSSLYNVSSKDLYQASVFTKEGTSEKLQKVSFAVNPGYSYVVYYAPYNNGNWKSDKANWINLGTLSGSDVSYAGIKSINVSSKKLKIDNKYVIIVKGTKPSGSGYNNATIIYKDKYYSDNTISTIKLDVKEDENYYSTNGSSWTDLYSYEFSFNFQCDENNDGVKETCTYNSRDVYEGAKNIIYAYTKEEESTVDTSVVNSSEEDVDNFYSFDDSKVKIDFSNVTNVIGNYNITIVNSSNKDYTSYFSASLDNNKKQLLLETASNKYIPVGTYSFVITYDLDNSGNHEYTLKGSFIVTKPFNVGSVTSSTDDGNIYNDSSFNVSLTNYATTITNNTLTYLIELNSKNVTNSFTINYANGSITLTPKTSVEAGTYKISISINGNDLEHTNFEVHEAYTMTYTPEEEELLIKPDSSTNTYTVEELSNNVSSKYGYSILNSKNEVINPSLIGTGMKLKLNTSQTDFKTYTFVIVGDLSGDGKVSTADYVRLWNHLDRSVNYTITDENVLKAADISNDGKLSTSDYVRLWNQLKRG